MNRIFPVMNFSRLSFTVMLLALAGHYLLVPMPATAQLLDPRVTIDLQRLPDEGRAKLQGLDSLLESYLREQEWAADDYNYDFGIDINIFFTDYSPDPQLDKYKAKLIVTNRGDVRFEDPRWEFGLRAPFLFRPASYDPFKSVIEYYVWMLVGTEYDKLEKLGGRPWFEKARQIYLESNSSLFFYGWNERIEALRAYIDEKNDFFREMNFFFDTGLYYDSRGDTARAKDYLYYALVKLQKVSLAEQEKFLESNHRPFAEALARSGYLKGVRSLAAMDPAHREVYESIVPEEGAK